MNKDKSIRRAAYRAHAPDGWIGYYIGRRGEIRHHVAARMRSAGLVKTNFEAYGLISIRRAAELDNLRRQAHASHEIEILAVYDPIECAWSGQHAEQAAKLERRGERPKLSGSIEYLSCSVCNRPIETTGTALDGRPCHIECYHAARASVAGIEGVAVMPARGIRRVWDWIRGRK